MAVKVKSSKPIVFNQHLLYASLGFCPVCHFRSSTILNVLLYVGLCIHVIALYTRMRPLAFNKIDGPSSYQSRMVATYLKSETKLPVIQVLQTSNKLSSSTQKPGVILSRSDSQPSAAVEVKSRRHNKYMLQGVYVYVGVVIHVLGRQGQKSVTCKLLALHRPRYVT